MSSLTKDLSPIFAINPKVCRDPLEEEKNFISDFNLLRAFDNIVAGIDADFP